MASCATSCFLRSANTTRLLSGASCHGNISHPSVAFYSQGVNSQIPTECPLHHHQAPKTQQRPYTVNTASAAVNLDTAASINANFTNVPRPFEDIPVPGKYDKGIMGVLGPVFHAWRGGAFTKPHEYMVKCAKEFGPIFRNNSVMGWMVQLSDPEDFEMVYRHVGKYPNRPIIKCWVEHRHRTNHSVGLLTSSKEEWHQLRSAVSKGILKPSALVLHVDAMHEVVVDFIERIKTVRRQDGVIPDIETELYKWSMESSATFFFDKRLNLFEEKVQQEIQDYFNALQVLTWETGRILTQPAEFLNLFPQSHNPIKKCDKAWDVVFALSKKYIDEKMSELSKEAAAGEKLHDGTFVAYLMQQMMQHKLSPDQIYGTTSEIIVGAVDTTTHTSSLLIHELSKKPEIQDKIYDEVMRIIPNGTVPTADMLDSMTYVKAVVKETQRLYPITLGTARILDEDIVIKGYNVPKGTHLATLFYVSCRDPKVFDDPYEFRPERWLDKRKKYHPFASLPFGHGTRMCVGRRLAQQEMYLLISELVRNFKIVATKPNNGTNCGVTIHPETSIEPKLINRI